MNTVILVPMVHRGQEVVALQGVHRPDLRVAIRKLPGVRWSQTHRAWYVPLQQTSLEEIRCHLGSQADVRLEGLQESNGQEVFCVAKSRDATLQTPKGKVAESKGAAWLQKQAPQRVFVSAENQEALERLVRHLRLHGYSPATIRTYRTELMQLLKLLGTKPVDALTPDEVSRYMEFSMGSLGISDNTAHSRINALKYYFEQVQGRERFFWQIPRPKKPLLLPRVLSETELCRLFNAVSYLKHKAILFTAYSAGLRVSEVARLQWKHVDRARGQILIEQAKGKKDRYVALSPLLEDILISYYRRSQPKPKLYVFESMEPGRPYSVRSMQAVFQAARQRAGIHKDLGFHSLRHSFATHLLEKGTDVRYIQELLGHFSIKTTTRYLHVARQNLVVIPSPLDSLYKSGGIRWDG